MYAGRWMLAAAAIAAFPLTAEAGPAVLAVPDVTFLDTSGEPVDQRVEHERRLAAFSQALRADLGRDGQLVAVALDCGGPCALDQAGLDRTVASAHAAGARYLLIGGIHKMSTLVSWIEVRVLDLVEGRTILERLLTFRGDTDEAWRRAQSFLVADITARLPAQ